MSRKATALDGKPAGGEGNIVSAAMEFYNRWNANQIGGGA
jgi:hypothetical protein